MYSSFQYDLCRKSLLEEGDRAVPVRRGVVHEQDLSSKQRYPSPDRNPFNRENEAANVNWNPLPIDLYVLIKEFSLGLVGSPWFASEDLRDLL